jgi:hypothetical protein
VVWDKTEASRPAMGRFAAQCEYVVWGTAGPSSDADEVGCLRGVIRKPVPMADKHHLTGKPTAVMQRLVWICPRRGVVLDPFAGSGVTTDSQITTACRPQMETTASDGTRLDEVSRGGPRPARARA